MKIDSNLEDMYCSNHFRLRDLINCGKTQQELSLSNLPKNKETIDAICKLSQKILDPIVDKFGFIEITFGFCSSELAKEIKKRPNPHIAPSIDQHVGHETNTKGNRICKRDGFAVDFKVNGYKSSDIAIWIEKNIEFDRMYFYGDENSLHISYAPNPVRQIIDMRPVNAKRLPKVIKDVMRLSFPK